MAKYTVENIRNFALCGHRSAGKTTLADRILNITGAFNRPASVDDGTSICDFDEEEKARKFTIESTVTHFPYADKLFNMIDTPGYPDFIGQAIGAMRGVDTAVIVINAQAGIEVNTRRVFAESGKAKLGRMIVLNRMDNDNIDFTALVDAIKELFGSQCALLNVPLGQGADFRGVASTLKVPADTQGALVDPAEITESLMESIIEVDEEVMTRYFDGQQPTEEELGRLLSKAVTQGTVIPIVCCSAKTGAGVAEFLEALAACAVPPNAIPHTAKNAGGEEVEVKADAAGPLVAPGIQDPNRPVRPEVELHSRVQRHPEERRDDSGGRRTQRREDRSAPAGAGQRDATHRRRGPRLDRGGRQDRRTADRQLAG